MSRKISSTEALKLLGEKVMDWRWCEDLKAFYTKRNASLEDVIFLREWNPIIKIADAWPILEKMQFSITQKVTKDQGRSYGIGIYGNISEEFNDYIWDSSAPYVICLAALINSGVEIEEIISNG